MKKTLKKEFYKTIIVSISIAFSILFLNFLFYIYLETNYNIELSKYLLIKSFESIEDNIVNAYYEKRYRALNFYANKLMRHKNIIKIEFFDFNNIKITEENKVKNINLDKFKEKNIDNNFSLLKREFRKILVFKNTIVVFNQKLGFIKIYFDISNFNLRQISVLSLFSLIMLILSISLLILVNRYLNTLVIKPISILMEKMKHIIKGNYQVQIEIKEDNEIGELAKIFNKMTVELKENIETKDKLFNQLEVSENYLNSIFNAIHSGIVTFDSNFKIIKYNSYFKKMFDINEKIVNNKNNYNLPFIDDLKKEVYHMNKVNNLNSDKDFKEIFFEKKYNDKIYEFYVYKTEIRDEKHIIVLIDDVTYEKEKDKRIARQQKLELIGLLTGGIAHDFNNIIAAMSGNLFILENLIKVQEKNIIKEENIINNKDIIKNKSISDNKQQNNEREKEILLNESLLINKKDLDEIKSTIYDLNDSIERAKSVTKQLLSLSREEISEKTTYNIISTIKSVEKILSRTIDKSVKLNVNYPDDEIYIYADKSLIEIALMNLCINAVHAMTVMKECEEQWGGILTIKINIINGDIKIVDGERIFKQSNIKNNKYCKIEIKDTGVGIKEENLSKIFDPLFTTKKEKTGTGFGLAMVKNTIYQHNGAIEVKSQVNKGTTFSIYLKIIEKDKDNLSNKKDMDYIKNRTNKNNTIKNIKIKSKTKIKNSNNNKTNKPLLKNNFNYKILVIDDEKKLLKVFDRVLSSLGYKIITTSSANESIEIFKEKKDEIDLVIVDLVMPEMNGEKIIKRFLRLKKNIKIILTSGVIDNRIKNIQEKYNIKYIQKPFEIEKISKIVKDIFNN